MIRNQHQKFQEACAMLRAASSPPPEETDDSPPPKVETLTERWQREAKEFEARRQEEIVRRKRGETEDQVAASLEKLQALLEAHIEARVDARLQAERKRTHDLISGVLNEVQARMRKLADEIKGLKIDRNIDSGNVVDLPTPSRVIRRVHKDKG